MAVTVPAKVANSIFVKIFEVPARKTRSCQRKNSRWMLARDEQINCQGCEHDSDEIEGA